MYLATWKIWCKQCTGQAIYRFLIRWNHYKSKGRAFDENKRCMQKCSYSRFENEGHNGFPEDVLITLIDKTHGCDHRKRGTFWKHVLRILAPYGLSV